MKQQQPRPAHGPSVDFTGVGLALGGNVILRDVSFRVEPGTVHCLIGPNGGGKTSLVRCLLGRMPHTGEIRLCGEPGPAVGYVPQKLHFDDTLPMTVRDFMAVACQQRPAFLGLGRSVRPAVRRVLERVGMARRMDRPFGALSGGERQRVLLAQALLPDPGLLILDEPATGLDAEGAGVLQAIIGEVAAGGGTVLVIHHDLAAVRDMAHAVTAINREVLFTGDPAELLTPQRVLTLFSASARAA